MGKKVIIGLSVAMNGILALGLFNVHSAMEQDRRTNAQKEAIEYVCKEWSDTYPQSELYNACVIRNVRKLHNA